MTIEPNLHWYGTYARRSAIADYLELLALKGNGLSAADLADLIRDNPGWTHDLGARIDELEPLPEPRYADLGQEIDASLEAAADVIAVLSERVEVAGASYPFRIGPTSALTYTGHDPTIEPYVRLLALTVGHATRTKTTSPPHQVFEVVLLHALSATGGLSVGLGEIGRQQAGGFKDTLTQACSAVGLEAYPDRAQAKVFANDEGVDVLTNLFDVDPRVGGLQLIGQATCAKSDDWDKKIQEPSPDQWRQWLGGLRSPVAYLAVPHHVEAGTRSWLMQKRDRDVFDRLRLAPLLPSGHVAGEEAILEAVLGQAVD